MLHSDTQDAPDPGHRPRRRHGVGLVAFFRSLAEERARAAEARNCQARAALDEVKELAWSRRDIAPELSTIITTLSARLSATTGVRELP